MTSPTPIARGLRFSHLAVGGASACGVATDGAVHCWGNNAFGQLGDGTSETRPAPARATAPRSARFVAVGVGGSESCGLVTGGAEVICWGGNGTRRYAAPAEASGGLVALMVGVMGHRCALDATGRAFCWGANDRRELVTGDLGAQPSPTPMG